MRVSCALLVVALTASIAKAGDCDCKHWPWSSQCEKECAAETAAVTSKENLHKFGLGKAVVDRIETAKKTSKGNSTGAIMEILSAQDVEKIKATVAGTKDKSKQ